MQMYFWRSIKFVWSNINGKLLYLNHGWKTQISRRVECGAFTKKKIDFTRKNKTKQFFSKNIFISPLMESEGAGAA